MRWFPDKLIVLLLAVVIDLYLVILVGCFFRNDVTSLCAKCPSDETEKKLSKDKPFEYWGYGMMFEECVNQTFFKEIPVFTWSPSFSSDTITDLPF